MQHWWWTSTDRSYVPESSTWKQQCEHATDLAIAARLAGQIPLEGGEMAAAPMADAAAFKSDSFKFANGSPTARLVFVLSVGKEEHA